MITLNVSVWNGDAKEPVMRQFSIHNTWAEVKARVAHDGDWFVTQQGFLVSWAAQQGACQPGSDGYRTGLIEPMTSNPDYAPTPDYSF